jgi:hypothetical protein
MQENQWRRNPVLTFWQSKRICSDNAEAWVMLKTDGTRALSEQIGLRIAGG